MCRGSDRNLELGWSQPSKLARVGTEGGNWGVTGELNIDCGGPTSPPQHWVDPPIAVKKAEEQNLRGDEGRDGTDLPTVNRADGLS